MTTTGEFKGFLSGRNFGFVQVGQTGYYIKKAMVPEKFRDQMVAGAIVRFSYTSRYVGGEVKPEVVAIYGVEEPKAPIAVLDTVAWFNEKKGYGAINCGKIGIGVTALLHHTVCNRAVNTETKHTQSIIPGSGMPVRALVLEQPDDRYKVVSFEWGKAVEAEYLALYKSDSPASAETVAATAKTQEAANDELSEAGAPAKSTHRSRRKLKKAEKASAEVQTAKPMTVETAASTTEEAPVKKKAAKKAVKKAAKPVEVSQPTEQPAESALVTASFSQVVAAAVAAGADGPIAEAMKAAVAKANGAASH